MTTRITPGEARYIWDMHDVFTLGGLAHERRLTMHPEKIVTYIVDRNINYTNICISACKFCAFFRGPGENGGYVLPTEDILAKVQETVDLGGYQILLQGGMNPDLPLSYYTDLLATLKRHFPQVAVHGFSPSEIWFMSQEARRPLAEIITKLRAAGLDSIPGGGAEILVNEVRSRVSPRKCTADEWLQVMETAHGLGMRTTATMMFGQGETFEQRIEHLERLRELQDRTGGFTAFIPWTFQPRNTRMEMPETSSHEYLKFLALSRLYLDNIDNIQASWVTQGPMVGQLALLWGANDFGSTMIEENVVAATGVHFRLPEKALRTLVERAGFTPRRRTMDYTLCEAAQ
ncbi:MAG: dehypoxanthine futalosine cyclase [Deltaproteobacteria bacterium]|nr:dehypoxanthine futalosine cyclase [Deltaproteobacteria bacterium]